MPRIPTTPTQKRTRTKTRTRNDTGKEEKGEITKYSFGEEELDPPELEGRNATAANQGGK